MPHNHNLLAARQRNEQVKHWHGQSYVIYQRKTY